MCIGRTRRTRSRSDCAISGKVKGLTSRFGGSMLMKLATRTMLSVAAVSLFAAGMSAPLVARGQDEAQIKRGQEVYTAQKCSLCHQIAGKGNKASPLDGVGKK